jgi:hypothetical protein
VQSKDSMEEVNKMTAEVDLLFSLIAMVFRS